MVTNAVPDLVVDITGFHSTSADLGDGPLDAQAFVETNAKAIGSLYPRIVPEDHISVGFYDDNKAEELYVGTLRNTIKKEFGFMVSERPMVLLFNSHRFKRLATFDRDTALAMLWRQCFKAVRLWLVRHECMAQEMLVPSAHLISMDYPYLFEMIERQACLAEWSPRRAAEEFDAAIVAQYLADLMRHRYQDGKGLTVKEITFILFSMNSSNCAHRIPSFR